MLELTFYDTSLFFRFTEVDAAEDKKKQVKEIKESFVDRNKYEWTYRNLSYRLNLEFMHICPFFNCKNAN